MNICLVFDNSYVKITKVFLTSLLENNKGESHNVFVIHSGLTRENIDELRGAPL